VTCVYYGTASFVVVVVSEWSSLKELEGHTSLGTSFKSSPVPPRPPRVRPPTPLTYMPAREKRREGWGEKREESVCAYLAGTFERLQPIPRLALTEPAYLYGRTDDAGTRRRARDPRSTMKRAYVIVEKDRAARAAVIRLTGSTYIRIHSNLHWTGSSAR
jgi:hypothetical protein